MSEKLNQLVKLANENEQLASELQELNKKYEEKINNEVITIADKYGLKLEETDFLPSEDLSLEELDSVAGGRIYCFLIGFGNNSSPDDPDCSGLCIGLGAGLSGIL